MFAGLVSAVLLSPLSWQEVSERVRREASKRERTERFFIWILSFSVAFCKLEIYFVIYFIFSIRLEAADFNPLKQQRYCNKIMHLAV